MAALQRIATRDNIHFKCGQRDSSLLHFASYNGHYTCVEFLVEKGISASVKDNQDVTPLHHCVATPPFTPDRVNFS
jgi:ankyrin repeat protein